MAKSKRYICDHPDWVDGVYVDTRLPFWTASDPKPDWEEFADHDHSSAIPVLRT